MCKLNKKNKGRRIDPCMRIFVETLRKMEVDTVMCCCGHGKYPMTVVVRVGQRQDGSWFYKELFTDKYLVRGRGFYRKDKQGYYYIPEVFEK